MPAQPLRRRRKPDTPPLQEAFAALLVHGYTGLRPGMDGGLAALIATDDELEAAWHLHGKRLLKENPTGPMWALDEFGEP